MEHKLHSRGSFLFFNKDYIAEFVYGGIDGAITTFAVVAGASGANLDISVIIILGVANLVADGFSMSIGNYFSTKAEQETYEKHKAIEYWEVEHLREKEIQEIREIYLQKGFKGELLEQVVTTIISNKDVWVDTMMKEELEMIKDDRAPVKTAAATFIAFAVIGIIPLSTYIAAIVFDLNQDNLFLYACLLTGVALTLVGYFKSVVTEKSKLRSMTETLGLGGVAAALSYYLGAFLEQLITAP